jgi:hypothetical protein
MFPGGTLGSFMPLFWQIVTLVAVALLLGYRFRLLSRRWGTRTILVLCAISVSMGTSAFFALR